MNIGRFWVQTALANQSLSNLFLARFPVPVVRGSVTTNFGSKHAESSATVSSMVGYVSSEQHRDIFEREKMRDMSRDFSGKADEFTSVRGLILEQILEGDTNINLQEYLERLDEATRQTGVDHILDRDIKTLATGELGKALIAKYTLA